MNQLTKKHAEKIRFAIVGALNTAIDFFVLLFLTSLGTPTAVANYPSSTAAVIFSFFANKNYTFKSKGADLKREITLFLVFTLFCAWVLQPLTIIATEFLLHTFIIDKTTLVVLSKSLATIVTLVFNYTTYSKFVFNKKDSR